jgi:hypothetical protein
VGTRDQKQETSMNATTPGAIDGLIRSVEDAQVNAHAYPILVHPAWFQTVCGACGGIAVAPQRSTVAGALTDRIVHARQHDNAEESHP